MNFTVIYMKYLGHLNNYQLFEEDVL